MSDPNCYFIYAISSKLSKNVVLVDISKDPESAWNYHKNQARSGSKADFHQTLRENGIDSFELIILYQSQDKLHADEMLLYYRNEFGSSSDPQTKFFIVYQIICLKNNKSYIGITNNMNLRWRQHVNTANLGKGVVLHSAIRKYGENNFKIIEIAQAETRDEIFELEKKFIIEHNTLAPNGYNLSEGGPGSPIGPEHAKNIREIWAAKSPEQMDEFKEKMKLVGANISDETRKKRSEAAKAQFANPVMKSNQSLALAKAYEDPERRKAISIRNKAMWADPVFAAKMRKEVTALDLKKQNVVLDRANMELVRQSKAAEIELIKYEGDTSALKNFITTKIINANGKINAQSAKRNWWSDPILFDQLFESTFFLKSDIDYSARIHCIVADIKSHPTCNYCGNVVNYSPVERKFKNSCSIKCGSNLRDMVSSAI